MKLMRFLIAVGLAFSLSGCPVGPGIGPRFDMDLGIKPDFGPHTPPDPEKTENIAPSQIAEKLKVGDIVRVQTRAKKIHTFRVYKVDDDAFWGVAVNEKRYKVPYHVITRLTVRRAKSGGEMLFEYVMSPFDSARRPSVGSQ